AGDELADSVAAALAKGADLAETLTAYFDEGSAVEATARRLFCHPNTVRYRLGRVAELTGYNPNAPRDAFTLQVALKLGHLRPTEPKSTPSPSTRLWDSSK
ncbi:MAG: helix-turn-helix domain-containing protein, partial [Propionibacteriaceae bacterium]|nr:helix-turn-helix domain-containing protein [Propionibacteriaceae bacterium]